MLWRGSRFEASSRSSVWFVISSRGEEESRGGRRRKGFRHWKIDVSRCKGETKEGKLIFSPESRARRDVKLLDRRGNPVRTCLTSTDDLDLPYRGFEFRMFRTQKTSPSSKIERNVIFVCREVEYMDERVRMSLARLTGCREISGRARSTVQKERERDSKM